MEASAKANEERSTRSAVVESFNSHALRVEVRSLVNHAASDPGAIIDISAEAGSLARRFSVSSLYVLRLVLQEACIARVPMKIHEVEFGDEQTGERR